MTSHLAEHLTYSLPGDGFYVVGTITEMKPLARKETGEIWAWQIRMQTTAGTTRILTVPQERTMNGPIALPAYTELTEGAKVGERWAVMVGVSKSADGKFTNYTAVNATRASEA